MVYLIHFETSYKRARHYIGYTSDLEARIEHHRNGSGAKLLDVVNKAGIKWDVVRTWEGDRKLERKLKNRKNASQLCPVCREERRKESNVGNEEYERGN